MNHVTLQASRQKWTNYWTGQKLPQPHRLQIGHGVFMYV